MDYLQMLTTSHVAPLVGAWIEIGIRRTTGGNNTVAPLVGAWIEIPVLADFQPFSLVAPLVGAWIEIPPSEKFLSNKACRSPRGSVD